MLRGHSQAMAVAEALCHKKLARDGREVSAFEATYGPAAGKCDKAALEAYGPALRAMRLDPVKDSRIVLMSTQHSDPELAALLVNTAAKVYEERNLEKRRMQLEGAATFLGGESATLTTKIDKAERALLDFKKQNNVVAFERRAAQQNALSSSWKTTSEALSALEVRLIAIRAQRAQFATLKSPDPLTDVTPGVADSPVMMKLKELYVDQYARLLEMRGKYLERHWTQQLGEWPSPGPGSVSDGVPRNVRG